MLYIMPRKHIHDRKTPRHLLRALKSNNVDTLVEVLHLCDKRMLNKRLKYEVGDQHRLFSPILAAIDLSSTAIVKLLVAKGADVNKKGFSSSPNDDTQHIYTPLFLACCTDRLDIIPLLVEAGADINSRVGDKNIREEEGGYLHMDGVYPLLNYSLMYLSQPVTTALLLAGADPSLSLRSIAEHGTDVDGHIIRTLLQAGALLNASSLDTVSFLFESDIHNGCDIIEIVSCDFDVSLSRYLLSSVGLYTERDDNKQPPFQFEYGTEKEEIITQKPEMLINLCRRQIRKMSGNIRLFYVVDNLMLPSQLKQFLLFGYDLHQSQ